MEPCRSGGRKNVRVTQETNQNDLNTYEFEGLRQNTQELLHTYELMEPRQYRQGLFHTYELTELRQYTQGLYGSAQICPRAEVHVNTCPLLNLEPISK